MPRAQAIRPKDLITFFRTSSLDAADIMLDLCKAEVQARQQKSADAKAKAAETTGATIANLGKTKKAKPAKKAKAPKAAGPTVVVPPAAPPTAPETEQPGAGDAEQAGA